MLSVKTRRSIYISFYRNSIHSDNDTNRLLTILLLSLSMQPSSMGKFQCTILGAEIFYLQISRFIEEILITLIDSFWSNKRRSQSISNNIRTVYFFIKTSRRTTVNASNLKHIWIEQMMVNIFPVTLLAAVHSPDIKCSLFKRRGENLQERPMEVAKCQWMAYSRQPRWSVSDVAIYTKNTIDGISRGYYLKTWKAKNSRGT